MINWTERAHAFLTMGQDPTPKTPNTHLLGVLGVPLGAISKSMEQVSGVLGVPIAPSIDYVTLAADLLAAAMKCCDRHGDSDAARLEMRDQCLVTPPHLQADLLAHFQGKPAFDAEHDGG